MRAKGRDIVELFGFSPDDVSPIALKTWEEKSCPFTGGRCSKTNHDQSLIYGTCSVTNGISKSEGAEIIICPKRFYANTHTIFNDVIKQVWPDQSKNLVVGGSLADLKKKALTTENPVVAFGQNSGKELQIRSNGTLSMDWVLQSYKIENGNLIPVDFVGIEIQSIDITGNYRDNWGAYKMIKEGVPVEGIPNSGHGLNWANVHKRLIPQIIRKGNIYEKTNRCVGFFFILPDPPPINESMSGVNPDRFWTVYRRSFNGKEALYGGADHRSVASGRSDGGPRAKHGSGAARDWRDGQHVLPLAQGIWRIGNGSGAASQRA